MIKEWNEKVNLTAIIDEKEIIVKHFIDSLTILKYIKDYDKIIDVGTGAGLPGIPLKIVNDTLKLTLLDSLNKRINFLKEVENKLDLNNIEFVHGRAEDIAQDIKYREKYHISCSRAVARLNVLAEYCLPYVKIGGKFICMKGPNANEEIKEAKTPIKILGGQIEGIEEIALPDGENNRTIVIITKVKETPICYPRKAGKPSREPLL